MNQMSQCSRVVDITRCLAVGLLFFFCCSVTDVLTDRLVIGMYAHRWSAPWNAKKRRRLGGPAFGNGYGLRQQTLILDPHRGPMIAHVASFRSHANPCHLMDDKKVADAWPEFIDACPAGGGREGPKTGTQVLHMGERSAGSAGMACAKDRPRSGSLSRAAPFQTPVGVPQTLHAHPRSRDENFMSAPTGSTSSVMHYQRHTTVEYPPFVLDHHRRPSDFARQLAASETARAVYSRLTAGRRGKRFGSGSVRHGGTHKAIVTSPVAIACANRGPKYGNLECVEGSCSVM